MLADLKSRQPVALLCAAGFSMRFGADKRLVLLQSPLLDQALPVCLLTYMHMRLVLARIVIVVRCDERAMFMALLKHHGIELRADDYLTEVGTAAEVGLGCTIATGARFIERTFGLCDVMVALADMPAIGPQSLQTLIAHWQRCSVVVMRLAFESQQGLKVGHPVIFAADRSVNLQLLNGDDGAKSVLKAQRKCELVKVTDEGVCFDLDKPVQLAKVNALLMALKPL